jgi:hypothetical protein
MKLGNVGLRSSGRRLVQGARRGTTEWKNIYRQKMRVESFNESQKQHLLTNLQYADKFLFEIEGILTATSSELAFIYYWVEVMSTQGKVIRDYIARFWGQILRVIEGQGIR